MNDCCRDAAITELKALLARFDNRPSEIAPTSGMWLRWVHERLEELGVPDD